MEKDVRQDLELDYDNSIGTLTIKEDVVAMIAALAASEVEGVSAMVGDITREIMHKIGYKSLTRGVKVEVLNKKVKIDLSIIIDFGKSVVKVCPAVQEKVKNKIESMTDLSVTDINIRIAGVNMQ